MMRFLPYLTIPLTLFVFVSVILINVGGVNRTQRLTNSAQKNGAFNLVNWNYTISPVQSFASYEYHLFLNRLCTFGQSAPSSNGLYRQIVSGSCRDQRITKLEDGRSIYSPNALVQQISPFRFSTVNLTLPFAFYILTALSVFFILCISPFAAAKRLSRGVALVATIISFLGAIFILVASAIVTWQMFRLKHQLENNTLSTVYIPTRQFGNTQEPFTTDVNHVSVGKVVLGLTWASVVAMFIEVFMWIAVLFSRKTEKPAMAMKDERYVQG